MTLRRERPCAVGWVLLVGLLWACDPDGKKACSWVLEPEPKLAGTVEPGYVPLCARNRASMKEDCRLQATLEVAQRVYGRTFRYADLRYDSASAPRIVTKVKFCDGKD